MRRTLLFLAGALVLTLPAAAAARPHGKPTQGYLVVRNASTDGGVTGKPVATVVVQSGFVIGHVAEEGAVQLYHLKGSLTAQGSGADLSRRAVTYHGVPGTEFTGSDFRFRAVGGVWRVVVYGAGVSLYAAGTGSSSALLHGSVGYPTKDGSYSFDGQRFASLPSGVVKQRLGQK